MGAKDFEDARSLREWACNLRGARAQVAELHCERDARALFFDEAVGEDFLKETHQKASWMHGRLQRTLKLLLGQQAVRKRQGTLFLPPTRGSSQPEEARGHS